MRFKQQVILKHDHGITAQWVSDDWSWMAVATYFQLDQEGPDVDGNTGTYKKRVLGNCSGPWTGVSEDGKNLTIIPGFESERNNISGEANVYLSLFNAYTGGKNAFNNMWKGSKIGFDNDFWPEDKPEE